jgi:peptide/nickel transport system permease protein
MLWFTLRRIGAGLLVLLVVLILLVTMLWLSPIDPSAMFINPDFPADIQEQVRKNMGLDQGTFMFCINWIAGVFQFDLGYSLVDSSKVSEMLFRALPNTILLSVCSMVLIFTLGSLIGIFQAVRQYTKADVSTHADDAADLLGAVVLAGDDASAARERSSDQMAGLSSA